MKVDVELQKWSQEWQSKVSSDFPSDLRARVDSATRRMKFVLVTQVLISLVIGGAPVMRAIQSPKPDNLMLAAAVWLFIAGAWSFALINRRDTWSPVASTTSAYLDLSISRCRSSLRATVVRAIAYPCLLLFCLLWAFDTSVQHVPGSALRFLGSPSLYAVWGITLCFFGYVGWFRRRKQEELKNLLSLRRQLHDPTL